MFVKLVLMQIFDMKNITFSINFSLFDET